MSRTNRRNPRGSERNPRGSGRASTAGSSGFFLPSTLGFWDASLVATAATPIPNTAPGASPTVCQLHPVTFVLSTINGKQCISANSTSSSNYIPCTAGTSVMNTINAPCWMQIVGQAAGIWIAGDIGLTSAPNWYFQTPNFSMHHGSTVVAGPGDFNPFVATAVFNGAASRFYRNGVLVSSTINPGSGAAGGTNLAFLNNVGGGQPQVVGNKFGMAAVGSGLPSHDQVLASHAAWKTLWGIA